MRFIVFSDLHINTYSMFNENGMRLKNSVSVISDIQKYAKDNNIDVILFGGDLFDNGKLISGDILNSVSRVIGDLEIPIYAISGNHDQYSENILDLDNGLILGGTSLEFLHNLSDNFELIDMQVRCFDGICVIGVPFFRYSSDLNKVLDRFKKKVTKGFKNILLLHNTPNTITEFKDDFDIDKLSMFDLVLCGHIHTRKRLNKNSWLIGSPLMQSLKDPLEDRGFMVFDTDDLSNPSFINLHYPKFRREEVEFKMKAVGTVFNNNVSRIDLISDFCREEGLDEVFLEVGKKYIK